MRKVVEETVLDRRLMSMLEVVGVACDDVVASVEGLVFVTD